MTAAKNRQIRPQILARAITKRFDGKACARIPIIGSGQLAHVIGDSRETEQTGALV